MNKVSIKYRYKVYRKRVRRIRRKQKKKTKKHTEDKVFFGVSLESQQGPITDHSPSYCIAYRMP